MIRDLPPVPGVKYSEIAVTDQQQLKNAGFMEGLILAGRTPIIEEMEIDHRLERYIVIPPPKTTRDSTLDIPSLGIHEFYSATGEKLASPQYFECGPRLFREIRLRREAALKEIPVSLGPRGRDTTLRRIAERLGF